VSTNTLYPFLHLIFPFTQFSHSFRTSQKTIQTIYILCMYSHISSRNPSLISCSKHDLRQIKRDRQLRSSPSYPFIILTTSRNQAQPTDLDQFPFELTISLTIACTCLCYRILFLLLAPETVTERTDQRYNGNVGSLEHVEQSGRPGMRLAAATIR
jgi:hypothetical protein